MAQTTPVGAQTASGRQRELVINRHAMFVTPHPHDFLVRKEFAQLPGGQGISLFVECAVVLVMREHQSRLDVLLQLEFTQPGDQAIFEAAVRADEREFADPRQRAQYGQPDRVVPGIDPENSPIRRFQAKVAGQLLVARTLNSESGQKDFEVSASTAIHLVVAVDRKAAVASVRPANARVPIRVFSQAVLPDLRRPSYVVDVSQMDRVVGILPAHALRNSLRLHRARSPIARHRNLYDVSSVSRMQWIDSRVS